jgi:DNA-binding HxlR family transcriptional regulator
LRAIYDADRKEAFMSEDHDPIPEQLELIQRAVILALLRDDRDERWHLDELHAAIRGTAPITLARVLEDLERHGLVVSLDDWVLASRSARHLDELGLISI